MSTAKAHTKGPWRVSRVEYPKGEDVSFEILAGGEEDESVGYYPWLVCQTIMREVATEKEWLATDEANARLISAAPELLEALESCLSSLQMECDECPGCTVDPCTQCRAKAAIRKARGQ